MRRLLPSLLEEFQEVFPALSCCQSSGLTIAEDESKVYIEAAVPGIRCEDVEVTLDQAKRRLRIHAKSKGQRENVHYHLKAADQFNYEVPLSNAIDTNKPIEAICKEGILTVELLKNRAPEPLKVEVRKLS